MSQCEEMSEACNAIIFAARKALEAVQDMDHQRIKVWLTTISLTVADTRKQLGDSDVHSLNAGRVVMGERR